MEKKIEFSPATLEFRDSREIEILCRDLRLNFSAYLEDPEWGEHGILTLCEFLLKKNSIDEVATLIFAEHERLMVEDQDQLKKIAIKVFDKFSNHRKTQVPMEMTNVILLVEEFFPEMDVTRLLYALQCLLQQRPFHSAYITQARILKKHGGRGFVHEPRGTPLDDLHDRFKSTAKNEMEGNDFWPLILDGSGLYELPTEITSEPNSPVLFDYRLHRRRGHLEKLALPEHAQDRSQRNKLLRMDAEFVTGFSDLDALIKKKLDYWTARFQPKEVIPDPGLAEDILVAQGLFGAKLKGEA